MPSSHVHTLRVRYNECDPQNVVFNANYFVYFDIAMSELWRASFGSYNAMLDDGVDMVVVEATARYAAPARFDDVIDVSATVVHLGNTSMVTELTVSREDELLVEGRLVHVYVERDTQNKIGIPDDVRQALTD